MGAIFDRDSYVEGVADERARILRLIEEKLKSRYVEEFYGCLLILEDLQNEIKADL